MKMEDISRAAIEFGNEAGERLQTLLGRVPDPQEFMAFYGTASGTICGNALSEIVKAAGKEIGAQWLMETLGLIQLTARPIASGRLWRSCLVSSSLWLSCWTAGCDIT